MPIVGPRPSVARRSLAPRPLVPSSPQGYHHALRLVHRLPTAGGTARNVTLASRHSSPASAEPADPMSDVPRLPDVPRHVLSALVQNVPGVLAQISGMLASRGYNIESLAVGETEDPKLSRMTFVVRGDDRILEQVRKQLEKVVTVVRVV